MLRPSENAAFLTVVYGPLYRFATGKKPHEWGGQQRLVRAPSLSSAHRWDRVSSIATLASQDRYNPMSIALLSPAYPQVHTTALVVESQVINRFPT